MAEATPVPWLAGATFAHRGRHGPGAVENSATAFTAAIRAGLGIECDVQLSADGQAMVFHDFALDRLTGTPGAVIDQSADALTRLRLTGSGDTIMPLGQMLAMVQGRVPLLIEVKSRARWPWARLCAAVAAALADYPGPHAVMSFDPRVPRWFARHAPATPRGLVLSQHDARGRFTRIVQSLRLRWAIRRSRAQFLAADIRDLPHSLAARVHRRRGLPLATWTVRTPAQLAIARAHADAAIAEGAGLP